MKQRVINVALIILAVCCVEILLSPMVIHAYKKTDTDHGYNPATCTMEVKRVVKITPDGYVTKPAGPVFSGKQVINEDGKAEFLLQAGSGDSLTTFVVEITYENLSVEVGEVIVTNER